MSTQNHVLREKDGKTYVTHPPKTIGETRKSCNKCGEIKHVSEFHKKAGGLLGCHSTCAFCRNKGLRVAEGLKKRPKVPQNMKKIRKAITTKKNKLIRLYGRHVIPSTFKTEDYYPLYMSREALRKKSGKNWELYPIKLYTEGGLFEPDNLRLDIRNVNSPAKLAAKKGWEKAIQRAEHDPIVPGVTVDDLVPLYEERIRMSEVFGFDFVVDHIVPLAMGGMHCPENLQVVSAARNNFKATNGADKVMRELGITAEETTPALQKLVMLETEILLGFEDDYREHQRNREHWRPKAPPK